MLVLVSPQQTLWKLDGITTPPAKTTPPPASKRSTTASRATSSESARTRVKPFVGADDVLRAFSSDSEDYLVWSSRPWIIWDEPLLRRVEAEVASFETLGVDWFCLSADGLSSKSQPFSAVYFGYEPSLVPDRGRRAVVQTSGILCVINLKAFRKLGVGRLIHRDVLHTINDLIVLAYANGIGSFFTSGFYPCLAEHNSVAHKPIEDQLVAVNAVAMLGENSARLLRGSSVVPIASLQTWADDITAGLRVKHRFSFVVRTLFKRAHLLNRCLISIDYIRSSLDVPVEVVLATDVPVATSRKAVAELKTSFPELEFVVADGSVGQGYSRVRNLIAGIKASTGARVSIIDDDDYYTGLVVPCFARSCEFGTEELVIFDTQIVNEEWVLKGVKHHKEIMSYGAFYPAQSWVSTIKGSNSVPFCGIIHPGWFVRQLAEEYRYDYDLSEDFVFHLMCFAHRKRPPLHLMPTMGAYQSHRPGADNVSTVKDKTGWIADTGNGVYQLLFEEANTFNIISTNEAGHAVGGDAGQLVTLELQRAVEARDAATRQLAMAVARDRRELPLMEKQISGAYAGVLSRAPWLGRMAGKIRR